MLHYVTLKRNVLVIDADVCSLAGAIALGELADLVGISYLLGLALSLLLFAVLEVASDLSFGRAMDNYLERTRIC